MQPPKPFPSLLPWKLCPFLFFLPMYGASPFSFYLSFLSLLSSAYFPPYWLFLHLSLPFICVSLCLCVVHVHVLQAPVCWMKGCSIAHTLPYIQYDDHINSQSDYRYLLVGFNQWGRLADDVWAEGMQCHGNCRGCHKRTAHSSGTRCLCLSLSAWMSSPFCLRELLLHCGTYLLVSQLNFLLLLVTFFLSLSLMGTGERLSWFVLSI